MSFCFTLLLVVFTLRHLFYLKITKVRVVQLELMKESNKYLLQFYFLFFFSKVSNVRVVQLKLMPLSPALKASSDYALH